MYGMFLGIPLGIIVFVIGTRFLPDWCHEWVLGWALAACGALAVYNAFRGIDVLNDRKLDNPPPFNAKEPMPLVFGKIHEFIKEAQFGPFGWHVKTVDTDEMRFVAILKFTETSGGYLNQGRMQLERLIMLEVRCEQIEIEDPDNTATKIPGTQVQLRWFVDSPANRVQVNSIIGDTTALLQEATGVKPIERMPEQHPMLPPQWLQATTATLLVIGFVNHNAVETKIAEQKRMADDNLKHQQSEREKMDRQREEEIAKYRKTLEDQQKEWQERQSQFSVNPSSDSGVAPYAPSPSKNSTTSKNLIPNPYSDLVPKPGPFTISPDSSLTNSGAFDNHGNRRRAGSE